MEKDYQEIDDFTEDETVEEDIVDEEDLDDEEIEDGESEPNEEGTESKEEVDDKPKDESEEKAKIKEQNHINAERRKREKAEKEEALRKEGYNKALKESVNGINPYTNKKIEDDVDLEIYNQMRELEKQGKDPITDYAEYVASNRRKEKEVILQKKQQEEYATKDMEEFSKEYPDVDINKLMGDEHFNSFANGKLGNIPLTQVYDDFLKFESYYENRAEEEAKDKAAKTMARAKSSMGSMKNNGEKPEKTFKNMSDDEFEAFLKKVKSQTY